MKGSPPAQVDQPRGPFPGAPVERAVAGTSSEAREPAGPALLLGGGIALAVLVAALLLGGGAPQPVAAGLPAADALTRWLVPVAQLGARLAPLVAIGALLAATLAQRMPDRAPVRVVLGGAAAWLGASLLAGLLAAAEASGTSVVGLVTGGSLGEAVGSTPPARAAFTTAAMLVVLLVLVRLRPDLALPTALVALAPEVVGGHAATGSQPALEVAVLLAHVVAVTLWVGGLGALLLLLDGPDLARAVRPYSRLALGCFVVVGVTGVVSAWLRLSTPSELWSGGYGQLLVLKSVALVGLGVLGARHRGRTVAAVEQGRAGAFRGLAGSELLVMCATVALAVALARTPV